MSGQQNTKAFDVSNQDEPHLRRKLELLEHYPQIRALYGYDPRTACVGFAVAATQLGLAWVFQRQHEQGTALWGNLGVIFVFACVLGAILSHWCGMAIHECTHDLAAATPRLNRWVAGLVNLPMLLPAAATFRRYHLDHHILLGVLKEDTDLPVQFEIGLIGTSRFKKYLWLQFYFFVYMLRGTTFAKSPNRAEVANVLVQAVFTLLVLKYLGGVAVGYLALSTVAGHSLHPVAAHFIHEHYTFRDSQETYSYYGPINWLTFNVGYHNEHHDFMDVPGWRLPELHRIASRRYGELLSHRSWTFVLWNFIWDPGLGPHRRIVRSRETHDRVRRRLRRERQAKTSAQAPQLRPGAT